MIQPKTVSIKCQDGSEKEFIISKLPALAGREIVTQYLPTAMPKVGEYKSNEELLLKLMAYVAVPVENGDLRLTTRALVDNHVPDFECLMRLEAAMFEYNVSFFQNGRALTFFAGIEGKVKELISQTLTASSARSSGKGSRRTKS